MKSSTHKNASKPLNKKQQKHVVNEIGYDSLVLPGPPLTADQFREWILSRENGPTISLQEAKARWAKMKKRLLKLAK